MIDVTHSGLPAAMPAIKELVAGDLVALYCTGTPDIVATQSDKDSIPSHLTVVTIDQGFPGNSPNLTANERDCETGAWTLAQAVDKTGWNVTRPSLYLGFPNTFQEAYDAGWRGDVRLVMSSDSAPTAAPAVPDGITVTGIQWNFQNSNFDVSEMFDPYWPKEKPVTQPPATDPTPLPSVQSNWAYCAKCQGLFYKPQEAKSVCPAGGQHDGSDSYDYLMVNLH